MKATYFTPIERLNHVLDTGYKWKLINGIGIGKKTLIAHVPPKLTQVDMDAIIKLLTPGKERFHTILFDNEKLFTYQVQIKKPQAANKNPSILGTWV